MGIYGGFVDLCVGTRQLLFDAGFNDEVGGRCGSDPLFGGGRTCLLGRVQVTVVSV